MANNVQFQSSVPATPSSATIVETIDQGGGVQRQRISIGDILAGTAVAISSGTMTPSSALSITPSSNINVAITGVPTVALSSNPTVIPSSAVQVTLTSNTVNVSSGTVTPSSAVTTTLSTAAGANTVTLSSAPSFALSSAIAVSSGTVTLSSNPTVIPSSAFTVALSSAVTNLVTPSSAVQVTLTSNTVALSSAATVTPSSAVTVTPSSVNTVTLSSAPSFAISSAIAISSGTVTLSSNPTVIPSSAISVTQNSFVWNPGTSFSGLLTPQLTLFASDINSIASSGTAQSLVGGSSGFFTSSMTAQAVWGHLFLTIGGSIATAVVSGGNIAGWWMQSPDSATTFETYVSGSPLPRGPDWIIPLSSTVINSGSVYKSAGITLLPPLQFRIQIQNNTGQTLGTSNFIKLAAVGVLD
jgi:hypothetical protein